MVIHLSKRYVKNRLRVLTIELLKGKLSISLQQLILFLTWTADLGNNVAPLQQAQREVALAAVDDQRQGGKF
jgi:hypothetical protein